jgi:hypothetical protein
MLKVEISPIHRFSMFWKDLHHSKSITTLFSGGELAGSLHLWSPYWLSLSTLKVG